LTSFYLTQSGELVASARKARLVGFSLLFVGE
jgi:hypothetical protein